MPTVTRTFTYTGSAETWTVPSHKPGTFTFEVAGGQGRSAGPPASVDSEGGWGGTITGVLDATPGSTLHIIVGDGSTDVTDRTTTHFGPDLGGQGGDGGTSYDSNSTGGPGGTASEVRTSSSIADRIIVAGGGGGGGAKSALTAGGDGGAGGAGSAAGSDGTGVGGAARYGKGGTLSAAGTGGDGNTAPYNGTAGSSGVGGDGGDGVNGPRGAGGGGGGYFGGGGGGGDYTTTAGSGGGGSSWADTGVVSTIGDVGTNAGQGYVTFQWEPAGRRGLGMIR